MLSALATSSMNPPVVNRHQMDRLTVKAQTTQQVPITIQGASGQIANLQEWKNSSGTVVAYVNASNQLSIGAPSTTVNGSITFNGNSASKGDRIYFGTSPAGYGDPYPTVAIEGCSLGQGGVFWPCVTIYGGPSSSVRGDTYSPRVIGTFLGSANALRYSSGGNVTLCIGNGDTIFVDSNGRRRLSGYGNNADNALVTANSGSGTNANGGALYLGAGLSTGNATPGSLIFQTSIVGTSGSTNQTVADVVTITSVTQNVLIQATAATVIPLVVQGAASQTAALTQWPTPSNANNDGIVCQVMPANGGYNGSLQMGYNAQIKFNSSQYANTPHLQSTTSSNAAGFRFVGDNVQYMYGSGIAAQFTGTGFSASQLTASSGGFSTSASTQNVLIAATGATLVPLVVKGAASQSGDLQQWQNSAGTVLAKVNSTGVFFPVQAPTASAPAYVAGGMYYDTTLNKLRIGGASGWETVTSV